MLGKVVENGNQHAFRFAVFLVDIRRVVLHAEHFERLHRGDVLFLLLRDRIGVFRPLEILVVELFLKLGLHQICLLYTSMLDKIEVAVTFDADTITGIEVVSCNDTPGVCDAAVEKIPAEIVKYQSLGVDVATSATFTSNGILEAVALSLIHI